MRVARSLALFLGFMVTAMTIHPCPANAAVIESTTTVLGGGLNASSSLTNGSEFQTSGPQPIQSGAATLACSGGQCQPLPSPPPPDGCCGISDHFKANANAAVVPTASGFTLNFNGEIESVVDFNSERQAGVRASGIRLKIYAQTTNTARAVVTVNYNLSISWKNRSVSGGAQAEFSSGCGQAAVASTSSVNGQDSSGNTLTCERAVTNESISVNGENYYLVDEISASGSSGVHEREIKQLGKGKSTFSGSVNFAFKIKGPVMEKSSGDGQPDQLVKTSMPEPFVVRVVDGETGAPLSNVTINFNLEAGSADSGPEPSPQTAQTVDGSTATHLTLGNSSGTYKVKAFCPTCQGNPKVFFTATAITKAQATKLILLSCDVSGNYGQLYDNPMRVQAFNTKTGAGEPGFAISFIPTGSVSVNPENMTTTDTGIAATSLVLSEIPGVGSVRAHCEDCQANRDVSCDLTGPPQPPRSRQRTPPNSSGPVPPSGDFLLEMDFQALQPRPGNVKTIRRPTIDRIGVIQGDWIRFSGLTTPEQSLENSDFRWLGAGFGEGQTLDVQFNASGLKQEVVLVGSKNAQVRIDVAEFPWTTEKRFCASRPIACLTAAPALRAKAITWSEAEGPKLGGIAHNGPQDAIRHAYLTALMTIRVDEAFAEGLGTGHEGTGLDKQYPHNESVMDLQNNTIGRFLGQSLLSASGGSASITDEEIQAKVINAFNVGDLTIMDEDGASNRQSLTGLLRKSR